MTGKVIQRWEKTSKALNSSETLASLWQITASSKTTVSHAYFRYRKPDCPLPGRWLNVPVKFPILRTGQTVAGQTYFTQRAKSSSGCKGTCQLIPSGTEAVASIESPDLWLQSLPYLPRIGILTGIFSQYSEYRSSIRWLSFREQPKLLSR